MSRRPNQSLYEIWEKSSNPRQLGQFLHMLCHAVTLTFDLLTLNFYNTSRVLRLNSVKNMSVGAKSPIFDLFSLVATQL